MKEIDPLLIAFIKMGYEKENRIPVWFAVPGGIIAGTVTAYIDGVNILLHELGTSFEFGNDEAEGNADSENGELLNHVFLRDATIFTGSTTFNTRIATVDLLKVGAWGVGAISY